MFSINVNQHWLRTIWIFHVSKKIRIWTNFGRESDSKLSAPKSAQYGFLLGLFSIRWLSPARTLCNTQKVPLNTSKSIFLNVTESCLG